MAAGKSGMLSPGGPAPITPPFKAAPEGMSTNGPNGQQVVVQPGSKMTGPMPPEGVATNNPNGSQHVVSSAPPAFPNGTPAPAAQETAFSNYINSPLYGYLKSQAAAPNAPNYLNAFQGALGSARSDIAQQLAGALSDIKANQGFAQQALGQLPGQINASYNTANQLMNTGQSAAQAGMNAPGLNAATGANTGGTLNQYMQPERAAIAGEKAGEQANVPLLATGIQQAGSQEAAAANNAALSDYGSLAQQQAQLAGQAQIAGMNQQAAQQQQQGQNIFSLLQGAQNNKYTLQQLAAQQNTNSPTYGGLTQAQVAQVQSSPQYLQAVQQVQGGQYKTLADLQQAYPTNPALWQTVASQYGLK